MINVLVLEDDFVIATDIEELLQSTGAYKIYIASNYQDAVHIATRVYIHIIISDIHIKGDLDGIDTVKNIQSLYKPQVVFLTSFNDDITLQKASKVEFASYLLKPFVEKEFLTVFKLCVIKIDHNENMKKVSANCLYDFLQQKLFYKNQEIELTPKEQKLFLLLLNEQGKIIPFDIIDEMLWFDQVGDHSSKRRQLFFRLRSKLPEASFHTLKYQGYILDKPL
ncbi:response regulator [Sulfurimonas sp.]|uniref:response regulator n=1 Tax=Sulfurimonas sp. TaxID=2022749 RepID=UPI003D0FCDAA